jgi:hypothetical protein
MGFVQRIVMLAEHLVVVTDLHVVDPGPAEDQCRRHTAGVRPDRTEPWL